VARAQPLSAHPCAGPARLQLAAARPGLSMRERVRAVCWVGRERAAAILVAGRAVASSASHVPPPRKAATCVSLQCSKPPLHQQTAADTVSVHSCISRSSVRAYGARPGPCPPPQVSCIKQKTATLSEIRNPHAKSALPLASQAAQIHTARTTNPTKQGSRQKQQATGVPCCCLSKGGHAGSMTAEHHSLLLECQPRAPACVCICICILHYPVNAEVK
jgi:hypothetical protein